MSEKKRMSFKRKLLYGFLICAALGGVFRALESPEERSAREARQAQAQAQSEQDRQARRAEFVAKEEAREKPFVDAIRAKIKASTAYGDYTLEFADLDDDQCRVTLIYPKGPMQRQEAEILSKAAVLAVLETFQAQGKRPMKDHLSVYARVYTATKGVTGEDLVNVYGVASYNYNNDQIEWKRED